MAMLKEVRGSAIEGGSEKIKKADGDKLSGYLYQWEKKWRPVRQGVHLD